MKLIHISDLHLGKKLGETDLYDDQRYILFDELIERIIKNEKPDGVIIAGDIYDRSAPSGDAIRLFDEFLSKLSELRLSVYMISGNHDSSEKVSYGAKIMQNSGIHISEEFCGRAKRVIAVDKYGELDIYLLPFIRVGQVKQFYADDEISSYTDAVKMVLEKSEIDYTKRNIVVSHQFVMGNGGKAPEQCESETVYVGGLDGVSFSVFDGIDYTALGHIHGAQFAGRCEVNYCGTLLKYSASEEKHIKSVAVVELKEKGNIDIRRIPVKPLRDVKVVSGRIADILSSHADDDEKSFVYVRLTDKEAVVDAMRRLRVRFPNIIQLRFDGEINTAVGVNAAVNVETKTPSELFADFYELRHGEKLDGKKLEAVYEVFKKLGGGMQ